MAGLRRCSLLFGIVAISVALLTAGRQQAAIERERGAARRRGGAAARGDQQPAEGSVPRHALARAAHAAQRGARLGADARRADGSSPTRCPPRSRASSATRRRRNSSSTICWTRRRSSAAACASSRANRSRRSGAVGGRCGAAVDRGAASAARCSSSNRCGRSATPTRLRQVDVESALERGEVHAGRRRRSSSASTATSSERPHLRPRHRPRHRAPNSCRTSSMPFRQADSSITRVSGGLGLGSGAGPSPRRGARRHASGSRAKGRGKARRSPCACRSIGAGAEPMTPHRQARRASRLTVQPTRRPRARRAGLESRAS